jgi:arylsulfatase A-like enzyme
MRRRGDTHLRLASQVTTNELRRMWAGYCGAVSYVDHLLGTILAALVETDAFDNTLLVFTSDHGEMLGSHGLWSKGAVFYEELINVPLLIKPPAASPSGGRALPGGHHTNHLVSHVDLVPTILAWCGADVPSRLQGVDLRPLIEQGHEPARAAVPLEFHSVSWGSPVTPLRGWRTEDWKYVEAQDGTDELYDLRADPLETRNLITVPAAAPARERLRDELHRWLRETGDRWPEVPRPPATATA